MASLPLYKQIREDIKAQIAASVLRAGDRIPSESELMNRYFVSSITVKNALNQLVDEGIIYRLKGKGSFVAASPFVSGAGGAEAPGHKIGAIFPTMATRTEQIYRVHPERQFRCTNRHLVVGISRESSAQEIQLVQDFIKSGVHALILFPMVSEVNNALVRQLVAHRFPLVFMDRYLEDIPSSCVVADNVGGARDATRFLIERCGNKVAICHFPTLNTAVSGRLEGFRLAMAEAGCQPGPENQCLIEDRDIVFATSERRVELLYHTMLEHLTRYPETNGFFAANAEIAQVANLVLNSLQRVPGKDFHMVAFDNPHLPGVNFIQQDYKAIVKESVRLLAQQLDGNFEREMLVVPTTLVEVPHDPTDISHMRHLVTGLNP